jgi:hypothetical protein
LDEVAGDKDGGEAAELCKEWIEVGEETPLARLSSLTKGRSLELPIAGAISITGPGIVLAFVSDSSISCSCGGETGTEAASVGVYALGGEICAGLGVRVSSYRASWESGLETLLSELVTTAPLRGSRFGSLSETLLSTMGVRARRAASGPDKPKPSDGMRGREVDPSCGIPMAGSSMEERGGVEDTLEFDGLGVAL